MSQPTFSLHNKNYTYSIDGDYPEADILFYNLLAKKDVDFRQYGMVVAFVTYCAQEARLRAESKSLRKIVGPSSFHLVDVHRTFKTHQRLGIGLPETAPTSELVKDFLEEEMECKAPAKASGKIGV